MDDATGAKYPKREFRHVVADFTLDEGRGCRRTGYRPLWRIKASGGAPFLVGLCQMTVIGEDAVEAGETRRVSFDFWPGVQGYIEELGRGHDAEVCDGGHARRKPDHRGIRLLRHDDT